MHNQYADCTHDTHIESIISIVANVVGLDLGSWRTATSRIVTR
jgi:hypothetical protein